MVRGVSTLLVVAMIFAMIVAVSACAHASEPEREPSAVRTFAALDGYGKGTATCSATIACYQRCPASELGCTAGCDWRASQQAYFTSRTLLECLATNGCKQDICARANCGDELHLCGVSLALVAGPLERETPAASSPPAPVAP